MSNLGWSLSASAVPRVLEAGFGASGPEPVKPLKTTLMSLYPQIEGFESASIILPVINETISLQQSVDIILSDVNREDIREFIIVVCKRTAR